MPASLAPSALSLEESLVFWPTRYPNGNWAPDPGVEDAFFKTPDGVCLHGWYAEAKEPRAVILYAHGNSGNVTDLRPVLHLFRDQLNATILVFDYRGYGRSGDSPHERAILDDARTARQWLAQRSGIAESDVVLAGHSLGGAVAVDLAARDGARGLILESTFTSLPDVGAKHAPVRQWMQMRLESLSKIPNYHGPLVQTHGDSDTLIPIALGRKLFAAANEPKQFVVAQGRGHNDPPCAEYQRALDRFLGSLPEHATHFDSQPRDATQSPVASQPR